MNLIRSDNVLFSEGFLYMCGSTIGDIPAPPQEIYRYRKLSEILNMTLGEMSNMTIEDLVYVKETV